MQANESNPTHEQMWAYCNEVGGFRSDYRNATGYLNKLKAIADYWRKLEPELIAYSKPNPRRWFRSYPIDWNQIFTPVERDAWISIRKKGQVVLYPQYPVLNYHVDFGNPLFKIALEIDGEQYHKDKLKDQERDNHLKNAGWAVFRVTGREMWRFNYKDFSDFSDGADWYEEGFEDIQDWIMNSGDGVIEAIRCIYFLQPKTTSRDTGAFVSFCYQTLHKHCTTEFDFQY